MKGKYAQIFEQAQSQSVTRNKSKVKRRWEENHSIMGYVNEKVRWKKMPKNCFPLICNKECFKGYELRKGNGRKIETNGSILGNRLSGPKDRIWIRFSIPFKFQSDIDSTKGANDIYLVK